MATTIKKYTEQDILAGKIEDGLPIKLVAAGQFVKRKPDARKVYKLVGFDRSAHTYILQDEDDISRTIDLKPASIVWLSFQY